MISEEKILNDLMERITSQVVSTIKDTLLATIEREVTNALTKSLIEGEFYRSMNQEMRQGLGDIYKEISSARKGNGESQPDAAETRELFTEASDQLDHILQTTEKATVEIMDIVEKHLDLTAKAQELLQGASGGLPPEVAAELNSINDTFSQDLIQVMTTLSFQDITGQRIKRIITALRRVEDIVFEMFVSTGLSLKAKEAAPDKDYSEIKAESSKTVNELKGPQTGVSQNSVDDLLAQLGL